MLLITIQFRCDIINQSACYKIREIQYRQNNKWLLKAVDGTTYNYDELKILIHNLLFQVMKFSSGKKNQLLILFNDQIPSYQLRLLHLNSHRK